MGKIIKWIPLSLILCAITIAANAQICGTSDAATAAIQNRLLQNKAALAKGLTFPRSTQYVPVKFHLVNKNDGSGGILLRNVLDQLCALNNDYRSFGIQFYLKDEFDFINDDRLYSDHYTYRNLMQQYRDPSALNIWIVDNANPTGQTDYVAGYYTNSQDWVVIQKDEIKASTYTVPHEVGHFFGLLHTFNGWDHDPWQASKHGNPAPATSPNQVPTEYENESNCEIAGDYICDTPPDYNFGYFWYQDCNYQGGAKDPTGALVNPDESNFMGYFDACVRNAYHFSAQQKSLMQTDMMNENRLYVRSAYTPAYLQFSDTPTPELPLPGSIEAVYNQVNFQWTAVDGANHYLVEVSTLPVFSTTSTLSFITTQNHLQVATLDPNKTYYWRVQPFNEYYTCTTENRSTSKNFKTGNLTTAVQNVQEINDWQIHPNPQQHGAPLQLLFHIGKEFDAQIDIFNMVGQIVQPIGRKSFQSGTQTLTLTTNALPAGVYLLSIQTSNGISVKKFILQ